MGFLASTQVQIEAAQIVPWRAIYHVLLDICCDSWDAYSCILEIMELGKFHIPAVTPGSSGHFWKPMLRFIIVYAGQVSRWLVLEHRRRQLLEHRLELK